jgi:hypothetical protein
MRYDWRGDSVEVNLLRHLAALRLAEGDGTDAVKDLREAARAAVGSPQAADVIKSLQQAFVGLLDGSKAKEMPPLKALALFEENRDLVPAGAEGDRIIGNLVDRLVAVDLLGRAGDLLEDQVKHRLAGVEKTRAATRLALLRLLDSKPQPALDALAIDVGRDMPADLATERRQLKARALAALGRDDAALAALGDDASSEADKIRADIYWRGGKWAEAGTVFARLAPNLDAAGKLDAAGSRTVLEWAAALTLSGDAETLATMRQKYAAAMDAGPDRDAFRIVAGNTAPAASDLHTLVSHIAQTNELQAFLADSRRRLSSEKHGAVN